MNRRSYLILVTLLAAALVGVGVIGWPGSPLHDKATLGLDLQGGLQVTLKAVPPKGRPLEKSDLDRSVSIMRNRVDKLGVAEPEIRTQGNDQIVIDLPGVSDPAAAAKIIGKTAALELYDLEVDLVPPSISAQRLPIAKGSVYDLLAGQQALAKKGAPDTWYLFNAKRKVVAGPTATKEGALRKFKGKLPKGYKLFAVPPKTVVISCGIGEPVCPPDIVAPAKNFFYLFKYDPVNGVPEMTGADLKLSGTRQDFDTQTNQPIVLMQFTKAGSKKFGQITRDEAQRGRLLSNTLGGGQKITQHFAIVLDREIKSWPQIDWEEYPNGISGSNGAQITGLDSIGEARDLALVLQTGALPVKFVTLERTDISATLGKDSLQQAKDAALVGLLVVALFLLLLYRVLGVVAVIGLGIYAAFLYGAVLIFNVTLTLPGFAGLILTLGVAADANVVIFERIKEEARAGKSVRAAIAAGYGKGFHTILDANAVTAITALVLFAVATAGVKGFALMLLIGTAISLLTAVAATRAILGLLAGFAWFDNPRFMGAGKAQRARFLQVDFIGKRRLWFAISGVVVLLSVVALAFNGLNLGIDFRGGTSVTFKTPAPVALEKVRAQAARIGQGGAVIQGRGTATNGDQYRSFGIRTESLDPDTQTRLTRDLERTLQATSVGVKNVSASFGRQIAKSAILATIFSLLLIVAYITMRFQWKFALPVIVALAHDVVITVGVYALVGREVSTSTVAAVLTVLGYSIYDTIIIFDRIRENMPLMKRASFRVIANVSLWETIRRSLATTFITLLPILSLLFFGGATLKDFAFALLIGITSGAYSSIFVAAPLLAMWKEREPEYARRRDDESAGVESVGGALRDAPPAAVEAPAPAVVAVEGPSPELTRAVSDRRERRRQRRKGRPHGRAR